ncbi:S-layer homology domain-containing protein [Paenibacillus guangzhouensis]|uniref:S-layer homology domain-containing protein n=1 Tax=Paenibacillus guangzhouensis TaxID=1473112 RepID=UPI001266C1D5|nr:S-layer homology domain-containing protein [Paenibacillus guangzhouensis]
MKFRRWFSIATIIVIIMGLLPSYASASVLAGWEERSIPGGGSLYDVAYGKGMFVAVGEYGIIMTSADGTAWESHASGVEKYLRAVAYGGPSSDGMFVAVGDEGAILTSMDGENWQNHTMNEDVYFTGIAYGGGTFTAVAENGVVVSSRDGALWESQSLPDHALFDVAYGPDGKYVVVGEHGGFATVSAFDDTQEWKTYQIERGELSGVAYGNGMYVAVGSLPDGGHGFFASSTDGTSWVKEDVEERPFALAYGNGTFVAIGYKTIFTSTDGTNWTTSTAGTAEGFQGIAFGNESTVIVGYDGTILYSPLKYTVTYGGNGNTGGSAPSDNGAYSPGNDVVMQENTGNLVRTGYTFGGWNTQKDGKGTHYAPGAKITMIAEDLTVYAEWIGTNASLSGLTMPGVTLNPAFAPETTAYTANVPSGVNAIAVVPMLMDANASVTASVYRNETPTGGPHVLTNGAASPPLPLAVGSNTVQLTVTAHDGVTIKTYAVTVTRDSGKDSPTPPSSVTSSSSGTTPSSAVKPQAFRILINGKEQERMGGAATAKENGRETFTITVDAAKLTAQLALENDELLISVITTHNADNVSVELAGDVVKALANKQAVLEVRTPVGVVKLPAEMIGIDRLSAQLGANVPLTGVVIRIEVAKGDATDHALLDAASKQDNFTVISPVSVHMAITASTTSHGGKTAAVDKFPSYTEREIPLPDGVDRSKVTTAVQLDANGKVHHVPTRIVVHDGKSVALVSSLTNGTFALIGRSADFSDIEGHWAKNAVNGMASRMVINGTEDGRYHPDNAISRAEFAAIIFRALGLSDNGAGATADYTDVKRTDWYVGVVLKASEYGIVNGYEDGTFRPAQTITREEAAAMIIRSAKTAGLHLDPGSANAEVTLTGFSDRAAVSAWAKEVVAAAVQYGLIQGTKTGLLPKQVITRAETATIVQRLLIKTKLID